MNVKKKIELADDPDLMNLKDYNEPSRLNCWEGFRLFLLLFLPAYILSGCVANSAQLVIQSQEDVTVALKGFDGLTEQSLFNENLSHRENKIDIPYQGLALLVLSGGQTYPVIVGDKAFTLSITDPSEPPSFTGSEANSYFYDALTGKAKETDSPPNDFAHLMVTAKQLLESTHSIHTLTELTAKKNEFHEFVRENYENLKHSDMVYQCLHALPQ